MPDNRRSRSTTPTEIKTGTRVTPSRDCNKNKPPPAEQAKKRKRPSPRQTAPTSPKESRLSPSTASFLEQYKFAETELPAIAEDTVHIEPASITNMTDANATATAATDSTQQPTTIAPQKTVTPTDPQAEASSSRQQSANDSTNKSYAEASAPPENTTFLRGAPEFPKGPRDNRKAVKRPIDERDRDLRIMALEYNQDQAQISNNKTDAETQKNKLRVSPSPFSTLQTNEVLKDWWWNSFAKYLVCPDGIDPNPPGLVIRQINLPAAQAGDSNNGRGRGNRGRGGGRGRGRGGRGGSSGPGQKPPAFVLLLIFPSEIFVIWALEQYWGETDAGIRQLAEFHRRYKAAVREDRPTTDFKNGFMITTAFNLRPNLTVRQTLQNNWIRDIIRDTNNAIQQRASEKGPKTIGMDWMDANRFGPPQLQQTHNGANIKIRQQTGTRSRQNGSQFPIFYSKVVRYDEVQMDPRLAPYLPKRKKPTNVSGAVRDYMRPEDFTQAALRENDYAREVESPLRVAEKEKQPAMPYEKRISDDENTV